MCLGSDRHVNCILHRAVAPTELLRVFAGHVLSVMDDEVRVAKEVRMTCVRGVQHRVRRIVAWSAVRAPQILSIRLMVSCVHKNGAACRYAITEARRGVVQILRLHGHVADR